MLGTSASGALLIESGNQLTFDVVYAGQQIYDFSVTTDTLSFTDSMSGQQIVYTRVS